MLCLLLAVCGELGPVEDLTRTVGPPPLDFVKHEWRGTWNGGPLVSVNRGWFESRVGQRPPHRDGEWQFTVLRDGGCRIVIKANGKPGEKYDQTREGRFWYEGRRLHLLLYPPNKKERRFEAHIILDCVR